MLLFDPNNSLGLNNIYLKKPEINIQQSLNKSELIIELQCLFYFTESALIALKLQVVFVFFKMWKLIIRDVSFKRSHIQL